MVAKKSLAEGHVGKNVLVNTNAEKNSYSQEIGHLPPLPPQALPPPNKLIGRSLKYDF